MVNIYIFPINLKELNIPIKWMIFQTLLNLGKLFYSSNKEISIYYLISSIYCFISSMEIEKLKEVNFFF